MHHAVKRIEDADADSAGQTCAYLPDMLVTVHGGLTCISKSDADPHDWASPLELQLKGKKFHRSADRLKGTYVCRNLRVGLGQYVAAR